MKSSHRISELWIYPIKSCGGIRVQTMHFDETGPALDRRWMVVDETGDFVSQRSTPKLNLTRVRRIEDHLIVEAPGMPNLRVDAPNPSDASTIPVTVWGDLVQASLCAPNTSDWFSRFLEKSVRLVYFSDASKRLADQRFAPKDALVSFSDGFPVLVCTEASLDDLNGRLTRPVPMSRFRPNIVLAGTQAYEEDSIDTLVIGAMKFTARSPCARCSVTTVLEGSAERTKEPLRTLAAYRTTEHGVIFGQNLTHSGDGVISIEDAVHMIRR